MGLALALASIDRWPAVLYTAPDLAGGLLIGLFQRYLGDHPKEINAAIAEISQTGRLDYSHLPQGMLTASTSLIFGASLGPEAAIMDLMGGLGTLADDIMKTFRAQFNLSEPVKSQNRIANWLCRWPTIIAFLAGGIVFVRLLDGLYSGGIFNLSAYPFQWRDLLWTIPLALLGALCTDQHDAEHRLERGAVFANYICCGRTGFGIQYNFSYHSCFHSSDKCVGWINSHRIA